MAGTWLSSSNVGDNAILEGIIESFIKPNDIDLTIITSNPCRVRDVYGIKAFAPKSNIMGVLNALRKADALLFTGGTPFYDDAIHMVYFTLMTWAARIFGTRVIVFGISLRKMNKFLPVKCMKAIGEASSFIGAREVQSLEAFKRMIPDHNNQIVLLPDPAIQVSSTEEYFNQFADGCGLDTKRKFIIICPRDFSIRSSFHGHHYSSSSNLGVNNSYVDALAKLSEWLIRNRNYQVIFIPMHIHHPDDDRLVNKEVSSHIIDEYLKKDLFLVNEQYTPRMIHSIFSQASLVIGVRFHSLVLSFACSTPVISIGYAQKNLSVMQYLELEDYSFSLAGINFQMLKESVEHIEMNYNDLKDKMKKRKKHIDREYIYQINRILTLLS